MTDEQRLKTDCLLEQLNVNWLRPESALWRALDSTLISQFTISQPSLDLGCGNGIHSFISAGGAFSIQYDWYINTNPEKFHEGQDIYDVCKNTSISNFISRKPAYQFSVGLDQKINLLNQAKQLNFYDSIICHDANKKLPFDDESFNTVFSNIIYWLENPEKSLTEIYRVLRKGGETLLFIPNITFRDYCLSYQWEKNNSDLLKKINHGRSETMQWETSRDDFFLITEKIGFSPVYHREYLSELTLSFWDIGLRPISPILIKMANKISEKDRLEIKNEWITTVYDLLLPIYKTDLDVKEGGFHFFVLKK